MRFIVAGAGIGGLTASLALLREGSEVVLLDQAAALREIGAGIQISSNGTVVLREFGLEKRLAEIAIRPESIDFNELESGSLLYRAPLGDAARRRYGGDFFQVHRADLLNVIGDALPHGVLRLDARVADFQQDAHGVSVELASGETLRADALIGADGIHSTISEKLWGVETVHFGNKLMWRALVPADRIRNLGFEKRCHIWSGPGRSVVCYWVRPDNLFNFVGTVPSDEVRRESYTTSGDVDDLRRSFQGAEPRVEQLVGAIDQAFITGLYYRDPRERWARGRVTLLGDAAHAMAPFLAQGACASIEDAWVLAKCLARRGENEIPEAFLEYERRRRPRTTRVQAAARAMVKQLHETEANVIRARNGRLIGMSRIDPLSETVWGWLYDYNPLKEVNEPVDKVVGLTSSFEGKKMQRPQSQRAFDLWKSAFTPEDVARGIDGLRAGYERFLTTNFPPAPTLTVTKVDAAGVEAFWVESPNGADRPVVLHFHGGGYVLGSAQGSLDLAGRLADAVCGRCLTVGYRLAPEHAFPAALDDAAAAYRWLLAQGIAASDIIVSGESSGGGLAIATVLMLKKSSDPLPQGVIVLSPMTDLTLSGPSIDAHAGHDPVAHRNNLTLFAGSYFQRNDPADPLVSPLFGDFAGFPPLLIQAVRGEVLESDSSRLAERAASAGVDVTLHMVDDSVHVFALFPFLPETSLALSRIRAFTTRLSQAAGVDAAATARAPSPERWAAVKGR
jgi:salicylate hydroxylase